VEAQLANAKKAADEAEKNLEKVCLKERGAEHVVFSRCFRFVLFHQAMRDVQAARAEVRKEAERADALEDQVLFVLLLFCDSDDLVCANSGSG
jgi:hypothetical protein